MHSIGSLNSGCDYAPSLIIISAGPPGGARLRRASLAIKVSPPIFHHPITVPLQSLIIQSWYPFENVELFTKPPVCFSLTKSPRDTRHCLKYSKIHTEIKQTNTQPLLSTSIVFDIDYGFILDFKVFRIYSPNDTKSPQIAPTTAQRSKID